MRRGLTLIEVVIVVGIAGLMLAALTELLLGFYAMYRRQAAVIDVDVSAGIVVREVRAAALEADRVLASHVFSGIAYASGTSTLVLELPAVDASGAVVAGSHDYFAFYASGTDAYRLVEAAGASARASGAKRLSGVLSSLAFAYGNADVALATSTSVDVVTRATTSEGVLEQHLYEQVYLRNI